MIEAIGQATCVRYCHRQSLPNSEGIEMSQLENLSDTGDVQFDFGPFRLVPHSRLLMRGGKPVELGGRSFDLLCALVRQPGSVIAKRDLMAWVWSDTIVEEGSLRFHMANLRRTLGDGAGGARYIATQVGVGYAFVADVTRTVAGETVAEDPGWRPDAVPTDAALGRLPPRIRVIGRENELLVVLSATEGPSFLTIVGPGGVGKTTLAVEAAYRTAVQTGHKPCFIDLAQIEDPALVPSALAAALGIRVHGDDPLAVLIASLSGQSPCIVIDNCEHLVEDVAAILERIRADVPGVRLLATSREPLRARDEAVHWLGPLEFTDDAAAHSAEELLRFAAVQLFVERARAANIAMQLDTDDLRLIADMCRRLEGMALPIELAAVRCATHGVRDTHRHLGQHLSLGWAGRRTSSERQQTLRATLDWSHALLSDVEALALERLSVFVGPFSYAGAISVIAEGSIDERVATGVLDALASKGLVAISRGSGMAPFRLLEMTRTYAGEKLLTRGAEEVEATARRHALHCGDMLVGIRQTSAGGIEFAEELPIQLGNIRAALDWSFGPAGNPDIAIPLAKHSACLLMHQSLLVEARSWCERALGALAGDFVGSTYEMELQSMHGLALMFTRGNSPAAEVALKRALDVAAALGECWHELRVLGMLQIFHERTGDFHSSLAWSTRALEVAETIDAPEARAVAASLAGVSYHLLGDQARARRELEIALSHSQPFTFVKTVLYGFDHRNRSGIALARVLWLQGASDEAQRLAREVEAEAAALNHPVTHCIALMWTITVHIWAGDLNSAIESLGKLQARAEVNGFGPYLSAVRGLGGSLAIRQGKPREAVRRIEASLAELHAARYELLTTSLEISLIEGLLLIGREADALEAVERTLARCRCDGDGFALPELLRIKANILRKLHPKDPTAEATCLEGMDCARRQSARAWELRLILDLSRFLLEDGRQTEAATLLRPFRRDVREGADSADVGDLEFLWLLAGGDADPGGSAAI